MGRPKSPEFDVGTLDHMARAASELRAENADLRAKLEPANAEGIASEGGSAEQAANPRDPVPDALGRGRPMTKQKIREILASGGLSLLFTPKRQPTTEGGDASCPTNPEPRPSSAQTDDLTQPCSPAPSPTGGGAEDPWPARVKASVDALTEPDQPDWQALARDLAGALGSARACQNPEGAKKRAKVLARYHEAIAQHGEGV